MKNSKIERELYRLHAELCKTLSNPIRLQILDLLRHSERTVSNLAASIGQRQATVSQHIAILRRLGVVNARREGTNVFYSIANPKIVQAYDLIREMLFEQLCEDRRLVHRRRLTRRIPRLRLRRTSD